MTKRDVFSVAVKIIGIWTLVMAITTLPAVIGYNTIPESKSAGFSPLFLSALVYLSVFLMLLLGVILLYLSDHISSCLIKDDTLFSLPGWLADKNEVLRFAIITTGLVLLATHIPSLVYTLYIAVKDLFSTDASSYVAFEHRIHESQAISAMFAVGIGTYLVFGGKRLLAKGNREDHDDK